MKSRLQERCLSKQTQILLMVAIISFNKALAIANDESFLPVTHGVAVGEVSATRAVVWSRTSQRGYMHVLVDKGKKFRKEIFTTPVTEENDYTGTVLIRNLEPDTHYKYMVWFSQDRYCQFDPDAIVMGEFRTAPKKNTEKEVSFAWGGDLAGQNVCRDTNEGFPIFRAIQEEDLDFFIGLGDMIYADNTCEEIGRYGNEQVPGDFVQATNLAGYWAHWKYNREDQAYQDLLAKTVYYAIWDDHEVVNDFGPLHDTRDTPPYTPGVHLLPIGLDAFIDYNPIKMRKLTPKRLYRNFRWGKHLEIFILDTRQYRDANLESDDPDRPKTMLGREQVAWLKQKLSESNTTWKIIVSSVPVSIPTGFPPENGRDGWANFDQKTGFENELIDILDFMRGLAKRNVVFITTDVHFAEVFRYTPFASDSEFKIHEFVSGPLNAGLFPNRNFDDTLGTESLFFYGPESADAVTTYEEAKPFMNYGKGHVDEAGNLTLSINGVNGEIMFDLTLNP